MKRADDTERVQAAREAAAATGGLYVAPEYTVALRAYVERHRNGNPHAAVECLGFVESLVDQYAAEASTNGRRIAPSKIGEGAEGGLYRGGCRPCRGRGR